MDALPSPEAGLSRRSLLAVLAGLAALGLAGLALGPRLGTGLENGRADEGEPAGRGDFDLGSWPVRTVEIKNFRFDPKTATVIWSEYKE